MNDISTLSACPQILKVDGEEYKVYPLTFADLGELQVWIDSQFPDPFEVASKAMKSGNFNVAQQQYLMNQAMEKATRPKHLLGTMEADELLLSAEGYKQVLIVSIRKGDPSFTKEDADELFKKMTQADVARLEHVTNLDMVATDPKDIPLNIVPPSKENGSAMSRRQRRATRGTGGNSTTR